ncbi:unnamed protein product [Owenia fusiformis]|uniref:sphinganine-1-phosphate aldolase n=1 Tax=Owenia fusiformis TaxID=6347 RepID=A0A8J1Y0E2_OWEFU|nr:unnamed protein product [Owenia fusiformis]
MICWLEHIVFTVVVAVLVKIGINEGTEGVLRTIVVTLKAVPGVNWLIHLVLRSEVRGFVKQIETKQGKKQSTGPRVTIPAKGVPHDELYKEMEVLKQGEIDPEDGKIFAYVYTAGSENFKIQQKAFSLFCEKTGYSGDHDALVTAFHHAFMHENALNPMVFPSLRRMETEAISMSAGMLNGDDEVVGSLTSGGTESILMAVKTYRDRAKKLFPQIKEPEMVAPITIHPAFEKAGHYFGVKIVHTALGKDYKAVPGLIRRAITRNTIAILCSAPQYPHGVVDPVSELSDLAVDKGLPLHVDACFGGFMLPWVEKLGYTVPVFDFRLPGVTSMSADIHKYGFGAKGASVVLYRNAEIRKFQIFAYADWPGGLFGSPSMAGTRPGGNIAAAWAALKGMGVEGYMNMAKQLMDTTVRLKEGINKIEGLQILGDPHMTAFSIGSTDSEIDILALADNMEEKGWKVERQQKPSSLHCTIMPHHVNVVDELLEAMRESAKAVKSNKALSKKGSAAMYGMVGNIPDNGIVNDFLVEFFSEMYK